MNNEIDVRTKTLVGNIDPFHIIKLIDENPNDMILGKLIREYFLEIKKHISYEG